MSDERLPTPVDDGVALITLNRPDVRNALWRTMVREIAAFFEKRKPQWKGR